MFSSSLDQKQPGTTQNTIQKHFLCFLGHPTVLPEQPDYDTDELDAIRDFDFYIPTLHSLMDKLIIKTSLEEFQLDWNRVEKIFQDW